MQPREDGGPALLLLRGGGGGGGGREDQAHQVIPLAFSLNSALRLHLYTAPPPHTSPSEGGGHGGVVAPDGLLCEGREGLGGLAQVRGQV